MIGTKELIDWWKKRKKKGTILSKYSHLKLSNVAAAI